MKIVKTITKAILGSVLIISLLGLICSYEITNTILNKDFIVSKLEKNNYYENLHANIINEMKGYIGPSGLDEKIVEDIITTEKIKDDMNSMLQNIYENKEKTIEVTDIEDKLDRNIKDYLEAENLSVSNKENIQEFKDKIIEEYKKGVSYNTYSKYIKNISIDKIQKILEKVNWISLAGIIFSIIMYILLNLKDNIRKIYEVMIFVLSSGMIIEGAMIFITTKLKIDSITILNDAVSIIVRDIAKSILNDMMKIGGILIVISLLAIIGGNIVKATYKRNNTN